MYIDTQSIDLVCWDFGDTLCDELFMRVPPAGVPEWTKIYNDVLAEREAWVDGWMLGTGTINDLIEPLSARLDMTKGDVARHLRMVWRKIEWYPSSQEWLRRLGAHVLQVVVTVNPFEFSGISTACGLDDLVDIIVTSADVGDNSKVVQARHARRCLGLPDGLTTSLLIDNKQANIDEFVAAGGHGYTYTVAGFTRDAAELFGGLLS